MNFFSRLLSNLRKGIRHYPLSILFLIAIFIPQAWAIAVNDWAAPFLKQLGLALTLGLSSSFFFEALAASEKHSKSVRLAFGAVSVAIAAVAYPYMAQAGQFTEAAVAGISVAFFAAGFFNLFKSDNKKLLFSQLLGSLALAYALTLVFLAGVSVVISAWHYLLFPFEHISRVLSILALFSFVVLGPSIFLALIPHDDSLRPTARTIKILAYYAAFPIYIVLIGVLYAYIAKILITWDLPSGQINWFVSVASLLFVLFSFTILQYKDKVTRLFSRIGGYVMIPLIAMQIYMVYVRVNAYGLTPLRWVSIMLIATSIIFVLASLVKEMRLIHGILPVIAVVALLLGVGPFSVFEVPAFEQSHRLSRLLETNNILSGDTIAANKSVPEEERIKISSSWNELNKYRERDGKRHLPKWLPSRFNFESEFGFAYIEKNVYIPPFEDGGPDGGKETPLVYDNNPEGILIEEPGRYYDYNTYAQPGSEQLKYGEIAFNDEVFNIRAALDNITKNYNPNDHIPQDVFVIKLDESKTLYIVNANLYKVEPKYNDGYISGFIIVKE